MTTPDVPDTIPAPPPTLRSGPPDTVPAPPPAPATPESGSNTPAGGSPRVRCRHCDWSRPAAFSRQGQNVWELLREHISAAHPDANAALHAAFGDAQAICEGKIDP